MRLCPCRFKVPLMDNVGQPIEARIIFDLHRELLGEFEGFTIHPTSEGSWQNRAGRLFQEEIVVYEVAVSEEKASLLRDAVSRLGRRLGQQAMYFDAPAPSVEIIDLTGPLDRETSAGGSDEPEHDKTTRRRSKKNRPSG